MVTLEFTKAPYSLHFDITLRIAILFSPYETMPCPHCQTTLIEVPTLQSPQIDVCPKRHGLWMDASELNLFLEYDLPSTPPAVMDTGVGVQTASLCPRCSTRLEEHMVSGEGLLTCSVCKGWWVPHGVLTRLHKVHRGEAVSVQLDETSLYARAAAIESKRDRQAALPKQIRQGSSAGLLYWAAMLSIVSLIIGLLTWESLRRVIVNGHWTGTIDDGVFVSTLGIAGGIALFFHGFRLNRRKRLIETTPTSSIRSLAMGLVEITGQAEPDGPLLKAPFSAMPCVFFTYQVEERQRSGKQDKWVTIVKGESHQSFTVRDATGSVMILPIGAELTIESRGTYQNSHGIDLSPTVEAGLVTLGLARSGWLSSKTLRCTERFILPAEQVYILGTAQEGNQNESANEARLFIGNHPDGAFIISDRSERDLLLKLRWHVLILLYGGPALTAACAWSLLHSYVVAIP
jgi:Zn-finger nucleic acid-binding protein